MGSVADTRKTVGGVKWRHNEDQVGVRQRHGWGGGVSRWTCEGSAPVEGRRELNVAD